MFDDQPSGELEGASAAATPPSATPTISAPASTPSPVATVTAACPLLSIDDLKARLGGANGQTKVTAVESAPTSATASRRTSASTAAAASTRSTSSSRPPSRLLATGRIDSIAKGSHVVINNVTGVGQAGTFFTDSDGGSLIAVAKLSHGETRTVIFSAPAVVPKQNFISLAKLVLDRV